MSISDKPMVKVFSEGEDFRYWMHQVEMFLDIKGLSVWLTKEPVSTKAEEVKDDKMARGYLSISLSEDLNRFYLQETKLATTKALYDRLLLDHNIVSAQKGFFIVRELFNVNKSKTETVRQFDTRLRQLSAKAVVAGITISDELYMCAFLAGVHTEFGEFINSITTRKTMSDIAASRGKDIIEQIIAVDLINTDKRGCGKNSLTINLSNDSRQVLAVNASKHKKQNQINCFRCRKYGHVARDCTMPEKLKSEVHKGGKNYTKSSPSKPIKKSQSSNFVGSVKESSYNFCIRQKEAEPTNNVEDPETSVVSSELDFESSETSVVSSKLDRESYETSVVSGKHVLAGMLANACVLDSGAGLHTTRRRSSMTDFKPVNSTIIVGNNEEVAVTGIGKVAYKMATSQGTTSVVLNDVSLAVDLAVDIISVRKLTQAGCEVLFTEQEGTVYYNKEVVMVAQMIGGIYLVDIETNVVSTMSENCETSVVSSESDGENHETSVVSGISSEWSLWHNRLAHPSDQYMLKLLPGLKKLPSDFCETCALCKATALPHHSKSLEEKFIEKNEMVKKGVVHSDLMGPIRIASKSGFRWILTYMCEQSEYSYVFLLKQKNEQEHKFKEFKEMYEKDVSWKIKCLRSDNGLEYLSNDFREYLRLNGIKHGTSVARTPQSNGKIERLNRTLTEKARTLLHTSGLEPSFWGAAILTANYLRNRSPCKNIQFRTPFEEMFGVKPKLNHIKVFGCKCYPHIKSVQSKFEPTAMDNCYLIGYDNDGTYWIYNKVTCKTFRARDIKFNESKFMSDNNSSDALLFEELDGEGPETSVVSSELDNESLETSVVSIELESESPETSVVSGEHDFENFETSVVSSELDLNSETRVVSFSNEPDRVYDENLIQGANNGVDQNVRRSTRPSIPPKKLEIKPKAKSYVLAVSGREPETYNDAMHSDESLNWISAIKSELASIKENGVWDVVKRSGQKTVGTRWIFKIKLDSKNNPVRYKARLVAKGYSQSFGVDYNETFAPVVKLDSLRIVIAIAAIKGMNIHQMDVDTAFLNGDLSENVYLEPPQGVEIQKGFVLKLKKALYGLKQAPLEWNRKLVAVMKELSLKQAQSDTCIFYNDKLIVAIYVDDLLIVSMLLSDINKFKVELSKRFKTKDLGQASRILGLQLEKKSDGSWIIHQKPYIEEVMKQFNITNLKTVEIPLQPNLGLSLDLSDESEELKKPVDITLYQSAIGKLMYLMTGTRPDISFSLSLLSRFSSSPKEKHWRCVKHLMRYLNSTSNYYLKYSQCDSILINQCGLNLIGYSDADYASNLDDRKSTSGYTFMLNNCCVTWKSTKQKVVALSSTESEYIALATCSKEAIWLRSLLTEVGFKQNETIIFNDNLSSHQIAKGGTSERSKHIDVRHHFIRDNVANGSISIQYLKSEELPADFLTKNVNSIKHSKFNNFINLREDVENI